MQWQHLGKAGFGLLTAALFLSATVAAEAACAPATKLQFKNGKYRIMQFADIQDDQAIEPRSIELMTRALDRYKPDLVVFSGDNITGGPTNNDQVKVALNNIFDPVEARGIPFIATFGNHDTDSEGSGAVTWGAKEQYAYYRSFTCNINPLSAPGITGNSNAVALVYGQTQAATPKYAVWVMDTGRYAANPDAGQRINGRDNTWDHLKLDQVDWYVRKSKQLETTFGAKIPGLMWFHHPTWEFDYMWNNDYGTGSPTSEQGIANPVIPPYSAFDPQPASLNRHKIVGERNECVCTGPFNNGIYAAVKERGDVKGLFVGHDHINDFSGDYHGVRLGYAASAGFGTYGLGGEQNHRMRGVRVFDVNEATRAVFNTYMVRASDLGVCVKADLNQCTPGFQAARSARSVNPGSELSGVSPRLNVNDPAVAAQYEIKAGRVVGKKNATDQR